MDARLAAGIAVASLLVAAVPAAAHVNHLEADPQASTDGTVVVETAFIAADGWVVVHRVTGNGSIGEPIGHAPIDGGSGNEVDFPVRIDGDVWTNWTTRQVWIVLHHDDGDGRFEPDADRVLRPFDDPAGARVTVARGETAYVTEAGFRPEETDDRTVRIRRVAMPADGTLVVRNGSADGRIVARTDLGAGTHRNVSVALDRAFFRTSGGTVTLHAGLLVGGEPVRAGNATVGTTFRIVKPTPTATDDAPATRPDTGDDHTHADGHTHTHPSSNTHASPHTETDSSGGEHEHTHAGTRTHAPTHANTSSTAGPGFGVPAALGALAASALWFWRR